MNQSAKDVEDIFHQAAERVPGDDRRSFLDGACGGDRALRERVEALLLASETGDGYFEAPPPARRVIADSLGSSRISELISGRYRLLERLGEGGMGEVYLAEQSEPMRRRVALKLIKLGMDSRQVVARFEAERQALALMDHPNIARVLDGGTTEDGRPFFVMDLVRGWPVTDYCDDTKLDVRGRLALFVQICHAVQHAHQKGVIHRDLKPTNILVSAHDGRANPIIIDFGIAKALQQQLTDQTLFTPVSQMMGTPAYMSPEQAEVYALDVDTRSDIYTLGVVLYELLCGSTPLRSEQVKKATFSELQHLIRQEDPQRPCARIAEENAIAQASIADRRRIDVRGLKVLVGGELEWIAMKALEKDRQRRYATANALAADIGRFLRDDPVEACPPTPLYQFQKFVKKHQLPFAMVASAIAALGLGLVVSSWQAVRASIAEVRWHAASDEALEQLRNAYLYQARSTRKTLDAGRQFDSLAAIAKAAEIRPGLDLRNEAIAALAQPDLRRVQSWNLEVFRKGPIAIDTQVECFALASEDGDVDLFRLDDGTQTGSLPRENDAEVKKLRFSPDSDLLAVGYRAKKNGARHVKIWKLGGSSSIALRVPNSEGGAIDFTPDSASVAVGGDDNSIRVFNLDDENDVAACTANAPFWANCIRFSPDGLRFALCGRASQDVIIFDAASGEKLATLRHPRSVQWLTWRDDGELLATACSDFNAYVWDVSGAKPPAILKEFRGHEAEVVRVAFHPNRRFLFTYGWDNKTHVWNAENGQLLVTQPEGFTSVVDNGRGLVSSPPGLWQFDDAPACLALHIDGQISHKRVSLAFSPDGETLVAGTGAGLTFWELPSARRSGFIPIPMVQSVAYEARNHGTEGIIVGANSGVHRWSRAAAGNVDSAAWLQVEKRLGGAGPESAAVSANGHVLAVSGDQRITVFDATSGRERASLKPPSGNEKVILSPDGRWLASMSWHGAGLRVWDLRDTSAFIDLLPEEASVNAVFSPDSQMLVMSTGSYYQAVTVEHWDSVWSNARERAGTLPGHMAFSPDGRTLAVNHDRDIVRLLDPGSGAHFCELRPPRPGTVTAIAFAPDGRSLAVATERRDVHLWNLQVLRSRLKEMQLDWDR